MKSPRERWFDRIEKRVPDLAEEERTEASFAFLSSLTIDVLKWINTQHRRFPDMDEATLLALSQEAVRLDDQDRQGLLPRYWWHEYTPNWLKSAASE